MNRIIVPIIAIVIAIAFAGSASAQCKMPGMSGGGHDHGSVSKAKSDGDTKTSASMKDMTKQSQEMTEDFAKLHEHFGEMIQINDMKKLKEEMAKHNDMMVSLHKKMSDQQEQCQEMMSMMGEKSQSSSAEEQPQHNH
jgi:hypothetical protein